MRTFLLLALKAPADERFSLDYRSESALICRTIYNALWASPGIRRDTNIHISLNAGNYSPKLLSIVGSELTEFPLNERDIAAIIQKALQQGKKLSLGEELQLQPGIAIAKMPFEALVKQQATAGTPYYLHPRGKDIRTLDFAGDSTFILGDMFGIPGKTEKLLRRYAVRITLGPVMLHAAHCPILVHNELDRKERGWE